MLRVFMFVTVLSLTVSAALAQNPQAAPGGSSTTNDASYAIGFSIGRNINKQKEDLGLSTEQLVEGLMAALRGQKSKFSDDQMTQILSAFDKQQQAKMKAEEAKKSAAGEAFLAANAKNPGVKVTPSGLQYKVIKAGNGTPPKATDTVVVHYRGTLVDGTEFDSSYKRKMPATFPVNRVIPGWTEALQLMRPGDRWQLVIPSKLAYGERGTPGGPIGPNQTLIFDVELISVK